MSITSKKQQLRQHCRQARQTINRATRTQYEKKIYTHLQQLSCFKHAAVVASYMSIDNEVSTTNIHKHCWEHDKTLVLPHMQQHNQMTFIAHHQHATLQSNHYGIQEPLLHEDTVIFKAEDIDVIIIPLVGFDVEGNRLGFGGGYYDRFLAQQNNKPVRIGIAFEKQKLKTLPKEDWDITMRYILTEEKSYTF